MKENKNIIHVKEELDKFDSIVERWRKGEIDNVSLTHLIKRTAKQLERINKICYCDENVCCAAHGKHNEGIHLNCTLR